MPKDTTDSFEISEKTAFIFDAEHTGNRNFIVELLDLESSSKELLINTLGHFDGRAISEVTPGKYVFNVTYDEDYDLTPVSITEDDRVEPPVQIEGTDYAVIPTDLTGPIRFTIDAETNMNVIVMLKNASGDNVDLIFNERGAGEYATTVMEEGLGLFYIETLDDWTVSMEPL